jgi:hypothetical protein
VETVAIMPDKQDEISRKRSRKKEMTNQQQLHREPGTIQERGQDKNNQNSHNFSEGREDVVKRSRRKKSYEIAK